MWTRAYILDQLFYIFKQEQAESCGPASVLTLMRLIDNTLTPEAMTRLWFTMAEKALKEEGVAPGLDSPEKGTDGRIFDFSGGSTSSTMLRVLTSKRSQFNSKFSRSISKVSANAPGVILFLPTDDMGHWVVCIGEQLGVKGYRFFLDPKFGLVKNRIDHWPMYDPTTGTGDGKAKNFLKARCLIRCRP